METRFPETDTPLGSSNLAQRPTARLNLTKDALNDLKASQKEASIKYAKEIKESWETFDNLIEDIAVKHKRSINRVKNEFYMGRHIATKKHAKTNPWNAFIFKKRQLEKENTALPASSGEILLSLLIH